MSAQSSEKSFLNLYQTTFVVGEFSKHLELGKNVSNVFILNLPDFVLNFFSTDKFNFKC